MRKLLILLFFITYSACAEPRFNTEEEAILHRARYRTLYSGGNWINGEFFPNRTKPYESSWHVQGDFYYQLNAYRKENGLRKVRSIKVLESSATVAAIMCAENDLELDHDLFDGWDIARYMAVFIKKFPKYVSENLLRFPAMTDKEAGVILQFWKDSPAHNEAMLSPRINYVGLGGVEEAGYHFYALHMVDDLYSISELPPGLRETMGYPLD